MSTRVTHGRVVHEGRQPGITQEGQGAWQANSDAAHMVHTCRTHAWPAVHLGAATCVWHPDSNCGPADRCPCNGNRQWCCGDMPHLDLSRAAFSQVRHAPCCSSCLCTVSKPPGAVVHKQSSASPTPPTVLLCAESSGCSARVTDPLPLCCAACLAWTLAAV